MTYQVVIELPVVWSCITGHLLVHLFEGTLTIDHMKELEREGDAFRARHRGKYAELVVIFPSGAKMTSEERAHMARLIKRTEDRRVASATVILAEGITGAFQRSVLTGLQLLAPPAHPAKVYGDVETAVRFLAPHLKSVGASTADADALVLSVEGMCKEFRARGARK